MALREYLVRGIGSILGIICLVASFRTAQIASVAPIIHLVVFSFAMACFVAGLSGDRGSARRVRENQSLWRNCVLPFYVGIGCMAALATFVFTSSQIPLAGRTEHVNPIRTFVMESVLTNPMKPLDAREYLMEVDVNE